MKYLADTSLSETELDDKIVDIGEVGVIHGLIADAKGNIFLTAAPDHVIKYWSPDRKLRTLVQDSRLLWNSQNKCMFKNRETTISQIVIALNTSVI